MERLKYMKEALMNCVQGQISGNLQGVNPQELGEAIDMIKDLAEAEYYCSVVKAMEEGKEREELLPYIEHQHKKLMMEDMMKNRSQQQTMLPEPMYYDMERNNPYYDDGSLSNYRMYYGNDNSGRGNTRNYERGQTNNNARGGGGRGYSYMGDFTYPMEIRDFREGRSPITRRNYMESKEIGLDKNKQMKELEKYMGELSQDITEMISGASPEEKMMLQQKLSTLAEKVK